MVSLSLGKAWDSYNQGAANLGSGQQAVTRVRPSLGMARWGHGGDAEARPGCHPEGRRLGSGQQIHGEAMTWWELQPGAGPVTALCTSDGEGVALAQVSAWGCPAVSPWVTAILGCSHSAWVLSAGSQTSRSRVYALQDQIDIPRGTIYNGGDGDYYE